MPAVQVPLSPSAQQPTLRALAPYIICGPVFHALFGLQESSSSSEEDAYSQLGLQKEALRKARQSVCCQRRVPLHPSIWAMSMVSPA